MFWLARPFNSRTLVFQKSKPLCLWVSQENNNSHSLGEWPQGNPIPSCNQNCCISKPRKLHNAPINIIDKQNLIYHSVFSLVLSALAPNLLSLQNEWDSSGWCAEHLPLKKLCLKYPSLISHRFLVIVEYMGSTSTSWMLSFSWLLLYPVFLLEFEMVPEQITLI